MLILFDENLLSKNNHGKLPFTIEIGMRIAQMVIKPVLSVSIKAIEELDITSRGSGGFGSTGT